MRIAPVGNRKVAGGGIFSCVARVEGFLDGVYNRPILPIYRTENAFERYGVWLFSIVVFVLKPLLSFTRSLYEPSSERP